MDSLAGLRILIAEDESLIALELEQVLADLGCKVAGPVSRVADVVQQAQAGQLDGALLDVNLRGEQIFRALPQLIAGHVPLIITSGYDDAASFPEEFRALPRIAKPFDNKALREMCLTVFAKR
jgi:DNA-binding NtrC family response regulator